MVRSGSWTPRCPVALDELRLVTLTYWGFDHRAHTGRLIANADATPALVGVLRRLYDIRFPIRRMVPVDGYGASDERAMEADDTSVFNGRFVEGTTSWSQHAYGRAIDIDPLENPEIKDGQVFPTTARRYVDRTLGLPGMIVAHDAVVRAFAAAGWGWGGAWHSPIDYQHFSATGT
jgi:poly-gamma-glutamate synthesis protein (capsule biosynthesis protein)